MIITCIISMILVIFILNQDIKVSTLMLSLGNFENITLYEKWRFIYQEPALYLLTAGLIVFIIILIIHKLKEIKNTSPQ
jgi:hypothetical protein